MPQPTAKPLPTFRCRHCHHGFEAASAAVRCPRCGERGAKPWRFPVLEEEPGPGDGTCERPVAGGKAITPVGGSLVAAVTKLRSPPR